MTTILIASFVVACALVAMTISFVVIRGERRRADEDIILAAEPLRSEWIYGRRMDVPRRRPLLHTRSTKVMGK